MEDHSDKVKEKTQNDDLNDEKDKVQELIDKENHDRFSKPWSKLDKGTKLNRLLIYIKQQKISNNLDTKQEEQLKLLLINRLEIGNLNKISDIVYSVDEKVITEIKDLIYNEETKKYKFEKKVKSKTKSKTKSKSNIDRHFKR